MKKVDGSSAFHLPSPALEGTRKSYSGQEDGIHFFPFGQFLQTGKELWVYLYHILEVVALGWVGEWVGGGIYGGPYPLFLDSSKKE